jgi:hypothetical protein
MDDLKLMGENEEKVQKELQTIEILVTCIWNLDLTSVQRLYSRKGK